MLEEVEKMFITKSIWIDRETNPDTLSIILLNTQPMRFCFTTS